jgi:HSP20 family protein
MLPVRKNHVLTTPFFRRWGFDPFNEIDRVAGQWLNEEPEFAVKVDVREDDKHYFIEADMPGFNRDDINVTLENATLTISGERKREETRKDDNYHIVERSAGKFSRSFSLPAGSIKESDLTASLKNGVLLITIGKSDNVQPRKIEVKTD